MQQLVTTYKGVEALLHEMHVRPENDPQRTEEEGALALSVAAALLVAVQRQSAQQPERLKPPVDDCLLQHAGNKTLLRGNTQIVDNNW